MQEVQPGWERARDPSRVGRRAVDFHGFPRISSKDQLEQALMVSEEEARTRHHPGLLEVSVLVTLLCFSLSLSFPPKKETVFDKFLACWCLGFSFF